MCAEQVSFYRFNPENQLFPARPVRRQSSGEISLPIWPEPGKASLKKKKNVEAAYRDRSLSSSQLYRIIKQARAGKDTEDQRHLNKKNGSHGGSHRLRGRRRSR
jgi:hypothetical protein